MKITDNFFYYTFKLNKILFLLLPFTLISGPFLPDLTVVIMGLFSLMVIFYKKKQKYLNNFFVIFSLIFCIYIILRSLFSPFPFFSLESSLFYFRFVFFCICIRYLIEVDKKIIKQFSYSILFAFIILIIYGFYQIGSYYFGEVLFLDRVFYQNARVNSLFQEEYILGSFIIRLLPILIGIHFFYLNKNINFNFLIYFIFILSIFFVILSGERAAILLTFLYLSVLLFFSQINIKIKIYLLLSFILFVISFFYFNENYRKRIFQDTINKFLYKSNTISSLIKTKTSDYFFDINKLKNKNIFKYYKDIKKFQNEEWTFSGWYKFENFKGVIFMLHFDDNYKIASENRAGIQISNNKLFYVNKCCDTIRFELETEDLLDTLKFNEWNHIYISFSNERFKYIVYINGKKFNNLNHGHKHLKLKNIYNEDNQILTLNGRISPESKDEMMFSDTFIADSRYMYFSKKFINHNVFGTYKYDKYKYRSHTYDEDEWIPKANISVENILERNYSNISLFDQSKSYVEEKLLISKKNMIFFIPKSHKNLFITALNMFKDNPIFGHGPKTFRKICKDENYYLHKGCSTHPHNTYLQIMAETGLIGLAFIGLFFIITIIKFINNYKTNFFKSSIYCLIFINLWPIITTGSAFNNWLSVLYFLPIGFIIQDFDIKYLKYINNRRQI